MPKVITTPFAVNGQKNEITVNTPESDNSATYDVGFPPVTSLPIASGGKPPKGADFNGLFYDITDNIAYLTLGNAYVFNTGLSYPLNARINRNDGVRVRSTAANNTTNPNTSMLGWEIDSLSPSQNLVELTDKAVARTNLGVYSKAETDAIAETPNATETVAGKAKIATTAIAQAGVNDTDIITSLKLSTVLGGVTKNIENITSSLIVGTTYTNTLPHTIFIGINGVYTNQSGVNSFFVDSEEVWRTDWSVSVNDFFYALVPIGSGKTYRQASKAGNLKIMRYY